MRKLRIIICFLGKHKFEKGKNFYLYNRIDECRYCDCTKEVYNPKGKIDVRIFQSQLFDLKRKVYVEKYPEYTLEDLWNSEKKRRQNYGLYIRLLERHNAKNSFEMFM